MVPLACLISTQKFIQVLNMKVSLVPEETKALHQGVDTSISGKDLTTQLSPTR